MKRLTGLLVLLLAVFNTASGLDLKGTLPSYPNTFVTVYRYTNYVIQNTQQIAQVKTDDKGNFEIAQPDMAGVQRLKVIAQNESVSFYATKGSVYTITEKEKKLIAGELKPGLNSTLRQIDDDLVSMRSLWIDTDGRFILRISPEEILKKMDSVRYKYAISGGDEFNSYLDYYIAHTKIFFISTSYRMGDQPGAKAAFQLIGNKYFTSSSVNVDNPFYVRLLKIYMSTLANSAYFSKKTEETGPLERGLAEADRFANDSLRELAKTVLVNLAYDGKWYKKEMTIDKFNLKADSIGNSLSQPLFKDYVQQIVLANNKIKVGSLFPVIALQNVRGQQTDISKISAPYILVDIWATWCEPCKEAMEQFPGLMKKYKGKLMIAGISVDEHFDVMKKYLDAQGYTGKWEMLHNGNHGNYYDKTIITHYPTYYLLDKELRIVAIPESSELAETLKKVIQ